MGTDTLPVNRCDSPVVDRVAPLQPAPLPLEIQGVRRAPIFFSRLERLADPAGGSSASGTTSTWSFKPGKCAGNGDPPRPPVASGTLLRSSADGCSTRVRRRGCAERVGGEPLRPPPGLPCRPDRGIDSREVPPLPRRADAGERADERRGGQFDLLYEFVQYECDVGIRGSPPSPCTGESATSRITGSSEAGGTASWSG